MMSVLTQNGHLISPHEVYDELEKQDDELLKWAKLDKQSSLESDEEEIAMRLQIAADFPILVNPLR